MITAGAIAERIRIEINETETKHMAKTLVNISHAFKLVLGEHNWSCAQQKYEPASTLTISTAMPLVLPSDLDRINSVSDYSTSARDWNTYYEDFSKGRAPKSGKNWWYDTPVQTAVDTGRSASVDQDGTVVTLDDDTFHADVAGEYIVIGKDNGLYLISTRDSDTQITLARVFKGTDTQNATYIVRPPDITKRMRFSDGNGVALSPADLTIWYQRDMNDITEETDIIPIPNDGAPVYYKALQLAMRRRKWNKQASNIQPDYIHALALAKREDPQSRDQLKPLPMFRRPRTSGMNFNLVR